MRITCILFLETLQENHWKLQKFGDIVGLTISVNRINQPTNNYLDPLVLNVVLAIRIHYKFDSLNSVKPYLVHMDIFNENEIIMTVTEPHMCIIMDLLNSMKKYRSDDIEPHDECNRNVDNTDMLSSSKYFKQFILYITCINNLHNGCNLI